MMNPNYNTTVTLYNCLRAADNPDKKDAWYKTTLTECFYKNVIGRVDDGKTSRMANAYTVRIPESNRYLPYAEWVKLTEEERQAFFTLHLDDIVIKGACSDNVTGTSPYTAAELLRRHKPDSFVVTVIADNTRCKYARHYRIGG
ncbi:DUF6751 family protein [[Clostridium] scindens]|uniref:DUF6751 family protein n=1 Tax=Clostridium scindens (strain JCM 10418 / VPI 12708) TaxID=29347 RepID=UPI00242C3A4F|nr:DUF6751 family protein [[Clostridium] scindens]